jgi:hypothetical protein
VRCDGDEVVVSIGEREVTFRKSGVGGAVKVNGKTRKLMNAI